MVIPFEIEAGDAVVAGTAVQVGDMRIVDRSLDDECATIAFTRLAQDIRSGAASSQSPLEEMVSRHIGPATAATAAARRHHAGTEANAPLWQAAGATVLAIEAMLQRQYWLQMGAGLAIVIAMLAVLPSTELAPLGVAALLAWRYHLRNRLRRRLRGLPQIGGLYARMERRKISFILSGSLCYRQYNPASRFALSDSCSFRPTGAARAAPISLSSTLARPRSRCCAPSPARTAACASCRQRPSRRAACAAAPLWISKRSWSSTPSAKRSIFYATCPTPGARGVHRHFRQPCPGDQFDRDGDAALRRSHP